MSWRSWLALVLVLASVGVLSWITSRGRVNGPLPDDGTETALEQREVQLAAPGTTAELAQGRVAVETTPDDGASAGVAPAVLETGTVAGRVVNEAGAGIAQAEIRWTEHGAYVNWQEDQPGGFSAADGSFRTEGLPPGLMRLCALVDGGIARWSPPLPVQTGATTDGVVLVVAAGETLAGRVLDLDTGEGVGGVRVQLYPQTEGRRLEALSAPDGSYRMPGVRRGDTYQLAIQAEGYGYSRTRDGFGGQNVYQVTDELLAEGFDVTVRKRSSSALTLRVVDAASGLPLSGAEVAETPASREWPVEHLARAEPEQVLGRTSADGTFTFPQGFSSGAQVQADGYEPASVRSGELVDDLWQVRLGRLGAWSVRVLDEAGPAAGAALELRVAARRRSFGAELSPSGRRLLARGTTDAAGHATVTGLGSGPALLMVRSRDGERGALVEVELPGEDEVHLRPLATIEGRFAPPGPYLAKSWVVALRQDGFARWGAPDADGAFVLAGLPAGVYGLLVGCHAPDGAEPTIDLGRAWRRSQGVELAPGESRELEVPGFRGPFGAARGRLVVDGMPRAFAILQARWDEGSAPAGLFPPETREIATDADGAFVLYAMVPGSWNLTWRVSGDTRRRRVALARTELDIQPGETTELDFEASAGGLVIRARDAASGATAGMFPIELTRVEEEGDRSRENLFVPANGELTLAECTPGSYVLSLPGGERPQQFEIAAGEHVELVYLVFRDAED